MRQTISGLVAAIAVVAASTAPAMACGGLFGGCSPCGYVSPCAQTYVPTYTYGGCNTGCGAAYERLPDPVQQYGVAPVASPQYYYVDQGPTYSGPGNFAPYPTYQEGTYHHRYHHGYRAYTGYHYGPRYYAPHHSLRYGYYGVHHHYGYREHVLRRYY